jgi:S-formylglutathione hydrolase
MAAATVRALRQLSSSRCFNGVLQKYAHASSTTGTEMKFSVFLPDTAVAGQKAPVLSYAIQPCISTL